jgi:very-short-patch-repair endonuclease
MPDSATTREDGIAVTTPARTLTDLARVVSPGLVRTATRQAEFLKLDVGQIVTDHNTPIGPFTVDFFWPAAGLVVEVGSDGSHRGRQAFEDGHAREIYLAGRGLRLRRCSDSQIYCQAASVAASVLAELRNGDFQSDTD